MAVAAQFETESGHRQARMLLHKTLKWFVAGEVAPVLRGVSLGRLGHVAQCGIE